MKKIEIVSLLSESKAVIELLQRRGVVELISRSGEGLEKMNTSSFVSLFEKNRSQIENALLLVNKYSPKKAGLLDSIKERDVYTTSDFGKKAEELEKVMKASSKVIEYSKKIANASSEISKKAVLVDSLESWKDYDLELGFKGTLCTKAFRGFISGKCDLEKLENDLGEETVLKAVNVTDRQTNLFVLCHKNNEGSVKEILNDYGFTHLSHSFNMTASDLIEKTKGETAKIREEITEYENSIISFSSMRKDFEFFIDYLFMRQEKYESVNNLAMTKNAFVLSGYVPEKYASKLIEELERRYICIAELSEPGEDEDVPVLLENGRFSSPVESITRMYAMPSKRDVDPSPVMAFFYYLFFGMMLSDAGYGLVMLLGTSIILSKFTLKPSLEKSLKMFRYCGISTLIWGALFGSWFGDLPQVIASNFFGVTIKTTALWFEPLDDPIKLLLFSFLLGIAHLFLGLAVNFKMLWSEGKRFDAICEVIPVYITIIGVAPVAATILTDVNQIYVNIGKYLLIAGVILIVLTSGRSSKNVFLRFFGGIYGLYNIATGYLSDILSYSRLLALGLATGSIAGVINLIATMPSNVYLKAILLIVVGLVGHTANMGINLLGAYVHSDRLQFVELFSKFYEGGGREFKPLKSNTKYIKFEKENIYE